MSNDGYFMRRALQVAARPPFTSPNPRVGAVVVRAGRILAEAAHEGVGTPHAEAKALAGIDATGATLYVNLEPCVHHGHMPPCAPVVVDAGVTRVVIAHEDPDERVSGRGIAHLRDAGIDVELGTLAVDAQALNAAYLHHRKTHRPYVTVKLALSIDGRLAAPDRTSRWITGPAARLKVHARRLECDGILIGAGTVVADDPLLTVRDVVAPRQPVRVLCDARGQVPVTRQIFGRGEVIVMTTIVCPHSLKTTWKAAGAEVVVVPQDAAGNVDLGAVMENLGARGWTQVYCEGGAELATSLLRADLVQRLEIHTGGVVLGDGPALGDLGVTTMTEARRWKLLASEAVDGDVLTVWTKED